MLYRDMSTSSNFPRILASDQYGVDPSKITPDAHLVDDLGLDQAELLELLFLGAQRTGLEQKDIVRKVVASMSRREISALLRDGHISPQHLRKDFLEELHSVPDDEESLFRDQILEPSEFTRSKGFTVRRVWQILKGYTPNAEAKAA